MNPKEPAAPGGLQTANVLVADDDPILREFARVHLATPDVEVETVEDGAAAVERLRMGGIDIAMVDLDMPRLDGFGVIEAIRGDARLQHLPVVVITGREDMEAVDRAFRIGATSFVIKPLNWRLLSHQLAYVLRNARAEGALRAAHEAAERADTLKTNLLRLARHEFNTPMNAIIGFATLIRDHANQSETRAHATRILDAAKGFQRLHNDLFEAARVQSGEVSPAWRDVSIPDLLRAAARAALADAGSAENLRIFDRTGGAIARLDWELAVSALRHLVRNGFQHGVGPVTVVASIEADGALVLEVIDHGMGIASADAADLLQPFQQGEAALTRRGGGLGLGLATVSANTRLMGGRLGFSRRQDGAAVAALRFPDVILPEAAGFAAAGR